MNFFAITICLHLVSIFMYTQCTCVSSMHGQKCVTLLKFMTEMNIKKNFLITNYRTFKTKQKNFKLQKHLSR